MTRWFLLGCFLALTSVPALAFGPMDSAPAVDQAQSLRDTVLRVLSELRSEHPDEPKLIGMIEGVLADPAFSSLDDGTQHATYMLLGGLYFDTQNFPLSLKMLKLSCAFAGSTSLEWQLRSRAALANRDEGEALESITKVARTWPHDLANFDDPTLFQIGRDAHGGADIANQERAFLEAVFAASWKPKDAFRSGDLLWLRLVIRRLEQGDLKGAAAVAARIEGADVLMRMQADKRFDALIAGDPARYDVAKAFVRNFTDIQAKATAAPDKLEGINQIADHLFRSNHEQDAFDRIEEAMRRGRSTNGKAFSDYDDQLNWTMDLRSQTLFALGRQDEAFASLTAGAQHSEHGAPNVSQAINLADWYNIYDRPKDALDSVAAVNTAYVSRYGMLALQNARACAYYELGDRINLDKTLAEMRLHADDGSPFLATMLCTDDKEGAAREIIRELENPDLRLDALLTLQDTPRDAHATPRTRKMRETYDAVVGRSDVQAALTKVGRIRHYAFSPRTG